MELAKRYGLNPVILKEVVFLRNKGYNNVRIESTLGISRNTVSNYLEKLNEMEREDLLELLALIGFLLGGAYLVSKFLERKKDGG